MVLAGFQTVLASVEHEAVLAACPEAHLINVDENGVVSLRHLEASCQICQFKIRQAF